MENKKIICIKGNKTKLYEKVIFIMKEDFKNIKNKKEIDFVKEAENIINAYRNKKMGEKEKSEKYKTDSKEKIIIKNNKLNIIFYIVSFYFYLFVSLLLYTKLK